MKKTFKYFSMAALAMMGTILMGCAENDLTTEITQPNDHRSNTVTLTIGFAESAQTRALSASGVKTFKAGDKVALIFKNINKNYVKVESSPIDAADISDDGKRAKINVDLDDRPNINAKARLIYPASMAKITIAEGAETYDDDSTIDFSKLAAQDGTLESLGDKLDVCTCDFSPNIMELDKDKGAKMPLLTNRLAIGAFTIKDDNGTDITSDVKHLTISDGTNSYIIDRTPAAGPIYVAMIPTEGAKEKITITATVGTDTYEKDVKDVTLNAGCMYPVNVKMQKNVDLSKLTEGYKAQDGDILTGTLGTNVKISIAAGATVTLKNVNINVKDDGSQKWTEGFYAGITCLGDATIILEGTNKVQAFDSPFPGIQAAHNPKSENPSSADYEPEYTLTIQGDGSLEATGKDKCAGIGIGCSNETCGNIKIESGTINATGGNYAAGIGSGQRGNCRSITISGGEITAKGGVWGAGIGGGSAGKCGAITISGGTIKATGGEDCAGIGSSNNKSECGAITISGGTIKATGGRTGAGIGSGQFGNCGAITIFGGTITATGGDEGAGIGGGQYGSWGDITIEDGTIIATGGSSGAGIGCGGDSSSNTEDVKYGNITIKGGEIKEAKSSDNGAGIGSGSAGKCGAITISGGTIQLAQGGGSGAGIGSGYNQSKCGNITISGGTIQLAQGGYGAAGIGNGDQSTCGDITISGGIITEAKGGVWGAGIGSGDRSTCGDITISGGTVNATGGQKGAGIGNGSGDSAYNYYSICGNIFITTDVTKVTATKGENASNSIGRGYENNTCGTVTIGCTLDANGNPVGGTTGFISDSPYTYPSSN